MKLPVLVAVDGLDVPVRVTGSFPSMAGGTFHMRAAEDPDPLVWTWLGATVPARWLVERMIVASSNLAANLLLGLVGVDAVNAVWRAVGARHSVTGRGIDDRAAREAGITNLVTAADVAALMALIAGRPHLVDILLRQEHTEDFAAGLPPGMPIAHKNGWIRGVRHGAAIIFPPRDPPVVLVVLTSTGLPDSAARALLASHAAASVA
jgi:beta-lactamase class A